MKRTERLLATFMMCLANGLAVYGTSMEATKGNDVRAFFGVFMIASSLIIAILLWTDTE